MLGDVSQFGSKHKYTTSEVYDILLKDRGVVPMDPYKEKDFKMV